MNKTLHLVLKACWYDKIASGEKTSEYREGKPYWNKRLAWQVKIGDKISIAAGRHPYNSVVFHKGYTSKTMEYEQ